MIPDRMDPALIERIVEAALLAYGQPLTIAQLQALFSEEQPVSHEEIAHALQALQTRCAERGIELVEVASGYRFQVRTEIHPWITRLWTERSSRYGRAVLETLALIAYRQPITRGEIEQIRGVAVSTQVIRTLEERGWIRVVGHRDVPGKPALYGTNRNFLDYFGLKSLDQLPPLADINDVPDLEPELPLAPPTSDESGEPSAGAGTRNDTVPAAGGASAARSDPTPSDTQPKHTPTAAESEAAHIPSTESAAP